MAIEDCYELCGFLECVSGRDDDDEEEDDNDNDDDDVCPKKSKLIQDSSF